MGTVTGSRLALQPPVALQKALFAVLAPVGKLMGNRASYPEYSEADYLVEMHKLQRWRTSGGNDCCGGRHGHPRRGAAASIGVTTLATPSNLSEIHQGEVRRM